MKKFEGLSKLALGLTPQSLGSAASTIANVANPVINVYNHLPHTMGDAQADLNVGLNTIVHPVSTVEDIETAYVNNRVKPEVGNLLNEGENYASGLLNKFAPWLMLPVAYGLLSGNNNQQQPQGQPNYGAPIQPHYIPPQYFGQDKTAASTPALILGSLHRKAVSGAIDQITGKKEEEHHTTVPVSPTHVTGTDQKTKKLLEHPAVKDYINSLLNE